MSYRNTKEAAPLRAFGLCVLLLLSVLLLKAACVFQPPDLKGFACFGDQDCLDPLKCRDQRCLFPCQSDDECTATGERCISQGCQKSSGDGGPSDQLCVPSNEVCNGKDDDCDGRTDEGCLIEGERCEPFAAKDPSFCSDGLVCASYRPERPRVCLRPCKTSDSPACPQSNFACTPTAQGKTYCIQSACQIDSDCTYPNHRCQFIGGGQSLCLPFYPEDKGTLDFGSLCSPSEEQYCRSPLLCVRAEGADKGFCTLTCSNDGACSGQDPSRDSFCSFFQGLTIKYCSYTCPGGNDASCPTSMHCASQVCFVP